MRGPQDTLQLPTRTGSYGVPTPSGLTPNTRSEAEAALTHNTTAQTDAAAPAADLLSQHLSEAQQAYRRPAGLARTSSTNYEAALRASHTQESASSDLTSTGDDTTSPLSPVSSGLSSVVPPAIPDPFPLPGQGVVPRHASISSGQAEIVRKAKPSGMNLGDLGRQQSWSGQDFKRAQQGALMGADVGKENAGYGSGGQA